MKHALATFAFLCAALCATDVAAMDFGFEAYGDLRLIAPSNEISYLDGGLGKVRYGSEQNSPDAHISEIAVQAHAQFTGELSSVIVLRSDPQAGDRKSVV